MHKIKLRNVTIEDLDIVTQIEATCFPPTEAASKEKIKDRILTYPNGFILAEVEGDIAGFINGASTDARTIEDEFFDTMDLHNDNGKNLVIYSLAVLPEHQRKGVAKRLMEQYIAFARSETKETVVLTCKKPLIDYYEQFGYENYGVSNSEHGGAEWYDLILKL